MPQPTTNIIPTSIHEQFMCALYDSDVTTVRHCLQDFPELIDQPVFAQHQSPFDFVTLTGRLEMARLFIQQMGVDVNETMGDQCPLMNAVTDRNPPMVHLLLQHHADVNVSDMDGRTPIFEAVSWNNPSVIRLLIQHGADMNHREHLLGLTPLLFAVVHKRVAAVQTLLECPEIDVNAPNTAGHTALHLNVQENPNGWRPEPKRLQIMQLLLQHPSLQIDFLAPNVTALESSVRNGYMDYVRLLLKHDANPFRYSDHFALQMACEERSIDMIYEIVRSFPWICIRSKCEE
jgi:ankyrin repeat protein